MPSEPRPTKPLQVEEGWVPGPVGSLFLRQVGPSSSPLPPALLIHGLGGSSAQWNAVLAAFEGERILAAFDLRGHGQSDASDDLTAAALAADIQAVLTGLGWSQCRLIGQDLGAVAALEFLRRRPNQAIEVVLVDPPLPVSERDAEPLLDAVEEDPRGEVALQFGPLLAGATAEASDQIARDLDVTPARSLARGFETLVTYPLVPALGETEGRVEIWWTDLVASVPAVRALGGEPQILKGENHWPMIEPSNRFLEVLASWSGRP